MEVTMSNRRRPLDREASRLTGDLGKTMRRLRAACAFSLGELSERSGVAKSIISQIEANETNPTLSTLRKLSRALNAPIEDMLCRREAPALLDKSAAELSNLTELSHLTELSWAKTAGTVGWRHMVIKPGGAVEAAAHTVGVVENLTILAGALMVGAGDDCFTLTAGETARYHVSTAHRIVNAGLVTASAIQVSLLRLSRRQGARKDERPAPRGRLAEVG
jgi:transcriptional regulator with XRE-family HTH domain